MTVMTTSKKKRSISKTLFFYFCYLVYFNSTIRDNHLVLRYQIRIKSLGGPKLAFIERHTESKNVKIVIHVNLLTIAF